MGVSWAWSSSEVSCASCGSECQAACGTRNFRVCCFNFQRRRRAIVTTSQRPGVVGGVDWSGRGGRGDSTLLAHLLLRSLTPTTLLLPPYNSDTPLPPSAGHLPSPLLLPPSSPFFQNLSGDEKEIDDEEIEMPEGEEENNDNNNNGRFSEADNSLSRLVAQLALRSPSPLSSPSSALHSPPLPPSSVALNQAQPPSAAIRHRYQPQTLAKLRK
ncbi:hypothetical protein Pmani_002838 [Petrolisthes manimaculis]|uniref:Uncharacterized protein n=1 Tax=Petrolisthes manimaculis TaxID=1843537 RepID=A0AAE1QHZ2_9EUCA|nr:hypothetical protein Pmani_002838 [Petrolisthes manimaculis]